MNQSPVALITAQQATEQHVNSARPHAPVVAERAARQPRAPRSRTLLAGALQRAADLVAPTSQYAPQR